MAENPEQVAGSGTVTIGVVKETVAGETRVGLIPDSVKHLVGKGLDVVVETGAGIGSSIADDEYEAQGARIVDSAADVHAASDVVVRVQAPAPERSELDNVKQGQIMVSFLAPLVNHDLNTKLAESGVTAMAVDAVPRITRAQSMDALSAMSTIGGYKAVLLAADHLPKFFPLLMTAAGTIRPAKVLVLGAGVAGLQAIATARRLGAVVDAYDVRAVVKEQVESLGAKFVEIDTGADAEAAGGYAREATPEELKKQQEGLNEYIANADVVVTTALVPGRPAPKMIPAEAVERMRTGSVIVDLAAETGGNCELTTPGEITTEHGVTVIGLLNLPSHLPVHASQMYGKVITNFLDLLIKDGQINLNLEDEILAGMCITRDGEIVQSQTRKMMGLEELAAPEANVDEPVAGDTDIAEEIGADSEDDEEIASIDTDKLSDLDAVDVSNTDEPLVGEDPAGSSYEAAPDEVATETPLDNELGAASIEPDVEASSTEADPPIDLGDIYSSAPEPDETTVESDVLTDVSADDDVVFMDEEADKGSSFAPEASHSFDASDASGDATASGSYSAIYGSGFDSTSSSSDAEVARSEKLPSHGEGVDWLPGDGTREVPTGFPIKGNANSGLYHPPASSSYSNTIAEIFFASEEAAEAHGYLLPKALRDAGHDLGEDALNSVEEEMKNDE